MHYVAPDIAETIGFEIWIELGRHCLMYLRANLRVLKASRIWQKHVRHCVLPVCYPTGLFSSRSSNVVTKYFNGSGCFDDIIASKVVLSLRQNDWICYSMFGRNGKRGVFCVSGIWSGAMAIRSNAVWKLEMVFRGCCAQQDCSAIYPCKQEHQVGY